MNNKNLFLILVILLFIASALGWYLIKTREHKDISCSAPCQREVETALNNAVQNKNNAVRKNIS